MSYPGSALKRWLTFLAIVVVLGLLGFIVLGNAGGLARLRGFTSDLISGLPRPAALPGADAPGLPAPGHAAAQLQSAAAGGAGSSRAIKLAILAPLSGVAPAFGAATRDGALLAVREWNARGGVLGAPILPIVEDSQCNAAAAGRAANVVIDGDKVHYIVGEVCSSASLAISTIANQKAVVQISPTSTEPGVTVDDTGKVKEFIFRACFIDPFQGTAAANFALTNLHARTAVVMSNAKDSYSQGLAGFFQKTFTANGGKILDAESYTAQDTDFSAPLAKVAYLKPDVIYLPDYYGTANLITRQAKERGISIPFLGGDGWDSPNLDLKAAAGDYFTTHYSSEDPRPEVQTFVKRYEAAYPGTTPNSLAALAYDATNLMLEGIKQAGADDTTRVKSVLATIHYTGVTGEITFDAEHNPVKPAVVMGITPGGPAFKAMVAP